MTGEPPTLGLALGGGGARAISHVGLLKVLEREGIGVGRLAGTSMGALIAARVAGGASALEVEAEMLRLSGRRELLKLADRLPTRHGLFSGRRLRAALAESLGSQSTFEDLGIPLAITAVDLTSGREVVLRTGSVVEAVRASVSVPGIYAPVERDGCRLVDGGVLNNVPAAPLRELGPGPIVAVDVLPAFGDNVLGQDPRITGFSLPLVPGVVRDLWQTGLIMVSALTAARLRAAGPDVVLRPELPAEVTLLVGFTRAAELIAAGEAAAEEALPGLLALQRGIST